MYDPDGVVAPEGRHLCRLIDEVRREFFGRRPIIVFDGGMRQVNSVRVVTLDVFDSLSLDARLAVVRDLLSRNELFVIERAGECVFQASDTPSSHITDLVCEVVWQTLRDEPLVRIEDEEREATAGY